jgi:hypothetical protein
MLDFIALKHFRRVVTEDISDGETTRGGMACKQIGPAVMKQIVGGRGDDRHWNPHILGVDAMVFVSAKERPGDLEIRLAT